MQFSIFFDTLPNVGSSVYPSSPPLLPVVRASCCSKSGLPPVTAVLTATLQCKVPHLSFGIFTKATSPNSLFQSENTFCLLPFLKPRPLGIFLTVLGRCCTFYYISGLEKRSVSFLSSSINFQSISFFRKRNGSWGVSLYGSASSFNHHLCYLLTSHSLLKLKISAAGTYSLSWPHSWHCLVCLQCQHTQS